MEGEAWPGDEIQPKIASMIFLQARPVGKDEKFRMTNLEWGVDFFSMTNLVKTSSVGQI